MIQSWIQQHHKEIHGDIPANIEQLATDSRQVTPNTAFIAIRGTAGDGHTYIGQAVQKGASLIVCESLPEELSDTVCYVVVEDSRVAAAALSLEFYEHPEQALTCIGVTGTNGKTTISTLIWQILDQLDVTAGLLGTVAKRIGKQVEKSFLTTPGPVELAKDLRAMVDAGCTHLVMEVSSHALAQHRVDGIPFQVAIFTNLSHDHLDYHRDFEDYARAKAKLFKLVPSEGHAIINIDDEYGTLMNEHLTDGALSHPVSFKPGHQFDVISNSSDGLTLSVDGTEIKTPLVGRFNAYNVAQAFLALQTLGFSAEDVTPLFAGATGANGRLEKIVLDTTVKLPNVFVDYAHTPDALENVASTLADIKQKEEELVIVFGCGGDRDKTKRPKMAAIAEQYADYIYLTSDNPRFEHPESILGEIEAGLKHPDKTNFSRIPDRRKAIKTAIKERSERSIILIAGKGHETYQEIKGVRYPMDDRVTAREGLKERKSAIQNQEVS